MLKCIVSYSEEGPSELKYRTKRKTSLLLRTHSVIMTIGQRPNHPQTVYIRVHAAPYGSTRYFNTHISGMYGYEMRDYHLTYLNSPG